jgi:hypothetical protein
MAAAVRYAEVTNTALSSGPESVVGIGVTGQVKLLPVFNDYQKRDQPRDSGGLAGTDELSSLLGG